MKKIILILLLLFSINVYSQIDTSVWSLTRNSSDGKYSLITNKANFGGVGAGTITIPLTLTIADIDTSKYSLLRNNIDGKYSTAINKTSLYGIDSGMIKVSISYLLNPPTAQSLGIDTNNLLDPIDFAVGKIIVEEDSAFVPKSIAEVLYAKQVSRMTIDTLYTNKIIGVEIGTGQQQSLSLWGSPSDFETYLNTRTTSGQMPLNYAYANMADINLSVETVYLNSCNFQSADLSGANLSYVNLTNAVLSGADLSGAVLTGAVLTGADLTSTDLTSTDLSNATVDFNKSYIWNNCTYSPTTTMWIDGNPIGSPE